MQSRSISRHSGPDAHVDLDQKNSDSVFFDDKYLPNFPGSQHKKRSQPNPRPHQTKSKRKRVLDQKKLFMEISRDGKFSDRKSTLSRDERRVKRQLFIMESSKKNATAMRRSKVKSKTKTRPRGHKKGVLINPHFDLQGSKSVKSFMQMHWGLQITQESSLCIESQDEGITDDLDLSDIEDIRMCLML